MAHVKIDIHKAERQYELANFSDIDVVKGLIMCRSKLDKYFHIGGSYPLQASGAIDMNQGLICLYADLDELIDTTDLSTSQRYVIEFLEFGYEVSDIAEAFKCDERRINRLFHSACKKIVANNHDKWSVWATLNYIPSEWKTCSKCWNNYPRNERFFPKNEFMKDGYRNECIKCLNIMKNANK